MWLFCGGGLFGCGVLMCGVGCGCGFICGVGIVGCGFICGVCGCGCGMLCMVGVGGWYLFMCGGVIL